MVKMRRKSRNPNGRTLQNAHDLIYSSLQLVCTANSKNFHEQALDAKYLAPPKRPTEPLVKAAPFSGIPDGIDILADTTQNAKSALGYMFQNVYVEKQKLLQTIADTLSECNTCVGM